MPRTKPKPRLSPIKFPDRHWSEHPSGRPVHFERYGMHSIPRYPPDEPLTPGLRKDPPTDAIGFLHSYSEVEEDEYWDE